MYFGNYKCHSQNKHNMKSQGAKYFVSIVDRNNFSKCILAQCCCINYALIFLKYMQVYYITNIIGIYLIMLMYFLIRPFASGKTK